MLRNQSFSPLDSAFLTYNVIKLTGKYNVTKPALSQALTLRNFPRHATYHYHFSPG